MTIVVLLVIVGALVGIVIGLGSWAWRKMWGG